MRTWTTVRPVRTSPLWTTSTFNDARLGEALDLVFGKPTPESSTNWKFQLNIAQDRTNYYIYAILPGVSEDKLEINVEGRTLTISGELDALVQPVEGEFQWLRREFPTRNLKFSREIELPAHINSEAVEAVYNNGVLQLTVPQITESKARRITVNKPALEENKVEESN